MGAELIIDRKAEGYQFWKDEHTQDPKEWQRFGKLIRDLTGGEDVDIVFEHPGRETFGASVYVTRRGGTIVTCASTSGFMHEYDNRYLWMSLKRIIGSHFANYREAWEANRLISKGMIHPTLSSVTRWRRPARRRYDVHHNLHHGKVGVLCLAPRGGPRRARPGAAGQAPDGDQPLPERVRTARAMTQPSQQPQRAARDRPWVMRTYAGHSSAAESNALYRRNLAKGQTGLSVAFDLPTQTGYDPDHAAGPRRGRQGRRPDRAPGRHARALRRHPARADEHLDDDQRDGDVAAGALPGRRRGAGRRHRQAHRHHPERHHQGVPLPRDVRVPARRRRCG